VPLALSANSPFCGEGDSGFASARTVIFRGFPRTGAPRVFACYAEYVEAIDALIALGALPDATFLWWDVRLQPALGTVEVRVMDGQSSVAESAPLIALVQSLARLELESEQWGTRMDPEVLAKNRFLAARDGLDARLIDPAQRGIVPVGTLLGELLAELRPHAAALGCSAELEHPQAVGRGQRCKSSAHWVSQGGDLPCLVSTLSEQFTARPKLASHFTNRSGRSD
jgi:carboxylate-amine ligase